VTLHPRSKLASSLRAKPSPPRGACVAFPVAGDKHAHHYSESGTTRFPPIPARFFLAKRLLFSRRRIEGESDMATRVLMAGESWMTHPRM